MIHFRNDYSAGAHPAVLDALCRTNLELTAGYGEDHYTAEAVDLIRTICDCPAADVHFIVGGTQTNKTALGAFLRSYEAIIAADTGHICVHETGAIEQNGHKIIACPSPDGKLTARTAEPLRHCDALCLDNRPHLLPGIPSALKRRLLSVTNTAEEIDRLFPDIVPVLL